MRLVASFTLLALAGCSPTSVVGDTQAGADRAAQTSQTSDEMLDTAIDPCQDFYHYACGGWIAAQKEDSARYILAFDKLYNKIDAYSAAWRDGRLPAALPQARLVGDYMAACTAAGRPGCGSDWRYFKEVYAEALLDEFPAEAKRAGATFAESARAALTQRLESATWLEDSDRALLLAVVDRTDVIIGGTPVSFTGYEQLKISRTDDASNRAQVQAWIAARNRAPGPVPDAVDDNARYYGGVLVPVSYFWEPWFTPGDLARSRGAVGVVFAHEMGHAFDPSHMANHGLSTDASTEYDRRVACIADQYRAAHPERDPSAARAKQNENIADSIGMAVAFDALVAARAALPSRQAADERAEAKRFFVGYAQSRCETREADPNDQHADAQFRINGVLANLPGFAETYQCGARTKMVHQPSCSIF